MCGEYSPYCDLDTARLICSQPGSLGCSEVHAVVKISRARRARAQGEAGEQLAVPQSRRQGTYLLSRQTQILEARPRAQQEGREEEPGRWSRQEMVAVRKRVARRVVGAARTAKRLPCSLISPQLRGGLYGTSCAYDAFLYSPDAMYVISLPLQPRECLHTPGSCLKGDSAGRVAAPILCHGAYNTALGIPSTRSERPTTHAHGPVVDLDPQPAPGPQPLDFATAPAHSRLITHSTALKTLWLPKPAIRAPHGVSRVLGRHCCVVDADGRLSARRVVRVPSGLALRVELRNCVRILCSSYGGDGARSGGHTSAWGGVVGGHTPRSP